MHPTVKSLRKIVTGIEGAWVRRWRDGEIWVGIGPAGYSCDLLELGQRIELSGSFRLAGKATDRAFVVETK